MANPADRELTGDDPLVDCLVAYERALAGEPSQQAPKIDPQSHPSLAGAMHDRRTARAAVFGHFAAQDRHNARTLSMLMPGNGAAGRHCYSPEA